MGCGCGGSTYGAAENPTSADPYFWTGPTEAPKPDPAPVKKPSK